MQEVVALVVRQIADEGGVEAGEGSALENRRKKKRADLGALQRFQKELVCIKTSRVRMKENRVGGEKEEKSKFIKAYFC